MSFERRPRALPVALGRRGVRWLATLVIVGAGTAARGDDSVPGYAPCVKVTSRSSIIHLGSLDSFDRTKGGIQAAKLILNYLEKKDPESLRRALEIYRQIIPSENFGGEYTALQWFCDYFLAPDAERKAMVKDPYVASFFRLFADKDFAVLKEYLRAKYRLDNTLVDEQGEAFLRHRFHEDFILFNNPRRERWERSSEIIKAIGLKKGDKVADVGSGPGYFAFKFAQIVGDAGKVYASDNNDMHIDYLNGLVKTLGVKNVVVVKSSPTDVVLPRGDPAKVDCVFLCSLYHVIYCTNTEKERNEFLDSVRRAMKDDGRLVVVDNALVEDKTLPYHGPYIAKELLIAQLQHSGFRLVDSPPSPIPQRYILVFKKGKPDPTEAPRDAAGCVRIDSAASLVQFPQPGPGFEFSKEARDAAKAFLQALETKDKAAAKRVIGLYESLAKKEKTGNEHGAFIWFCEYLAAMPERRKEILKDPFVADYFERLAGDDFARLKKYLRDRYLLDVPDKDIEFPARIFLPKVKITGANREEIIQTHEFITFNNPRREAWEKTSKVIDFLKLKEDDSVADIGCGPGYYTFKFARLVPKGKVFASDTEDTALDVIKGVAKKNQIQNVIPVKSFYQDSKLPPDSADVIFLCSLYHAIYVVTVEPYRETYIESLKAALKKGGRLVICDNEVTVANESPYYGPRIDRRLIIEQLKHYGFELVDSAQFVPQRYVLVFKLAGRK